MKHHEDKEGIVEGGHGAAYGHRRWVNAVRQPRLHDVPEGDVIQVHPGTRLGPDAGGDRSPESCERGVCTAKLLHV